MNHPRYLVEISYATTQFNRFGKTEDPVLMTRDMLDIALKMADPIKCREWIRVVDGLKRGSFCYLDSIHGAYEFGKCFKRITVRRN